MLEACIRLENAKQNMNHFGGGGWGGTTLTNLLLFTNKESLVYSNLRPVSQKTESTIIALMRQTKIWRFKQFHRRLKPQCCEVLS